MTETGQDTTPPPAAAEPPPPAAEPPPPPGAAAPRPAAWLGVVLALVVIGVAAAPWWAPALLPLLPWGGEAAVSQDEFAKLEQRVAEIERQNADLAKVEQRIAALERQNADLAKVEQRVAALERQNAELAKLGDRVAAVERQVPAAAGLAPRIDRIEAAQNTAQHDKDMAAAKVDELAKRIDAIEKQRGSADAALDKVQQEVGRIGPAVADLAARLPGIEKELHADSQARHIEAPLALVLLQIREAIDQGRPFAAEYATLTAMAAGRPELADAAKPLADAAQSGVASRAVLIKRLDDLAGTIATAAPEPQDWRGQALARLGGLVTIRRIEGPGQSGPQAAVDKARKALAAGDLPGAVDALASLRDAPAEAAKPWLQMARQRLAAEAALAKLQQLLTAHLGAGGASPS